MDKLVANQTLIGKEIEKLAATYAAVKPEKKNLVYLNETLEKLNELWNVFEQNDNEIRESFSGEIHHQYFATDYYNAVKNGCEKLKNSVEEVIDAVKKHQTIRTNTGSSSKATQIKADQQQNQSSSNTPSMQNNADLIKIVRNQRRLTTSLEKMMNNIQKMTKLQSSSYYEIKIDTIQKYWMEIEQNHKIIYENIDEPSTIGYDSEEYFALQEFYQEILIKLTQEQNQIKNQNIIQEIDKVKQPAIKLPEIQLPKFDGNYLKWQQFYDLFTQMVHNQALSNAQKMFYLKSNLIGEAEKLIRHIPVADDNYLSAWEILTKRYANKRLLVTMLMEKLVTQSAITSESTSMIKMLHDTTKECIVGLENLGLEVYNHWDPMILFILSKKLDRDTHTLYEQSLQHPRELQSLRKFLEFLELRFQALEALGQRKAVEKVK